MCSTIRRISRAIVFLVLAGFVGSAAAQPDAYLSDAASRGALKHHQSWGDFGWDTSAAAPGAKGVPLRIGETIFARGLGHHANGEITLDLRGQFREFRASVGVQWQGGSKGSVVFQVVVDGRLAFECGPMSDSDPACDVLVSVEQARELRLIALDAGDGIACDMANWVQARLVRDPRLPIIGEATGVLAGEPAPPASRDVCGFSLIARDAGPQIAVMGPAKAFTVSVQGDEATQVAIPVTNLTAPLRIMAEVVVVYGEQAEVELEWGGKRVTQVVRGSDPRTLKTEFVALEGASALVASVRGVGGEAGVRWRRLQGEFADRSFDIPLVFAQAPEQFPPRALPRLRPPIEQELVEWDWRMQDGIGTEREARSWITAIEETLRRGDELLHDLVAAKTPLDDLPVLWEAARREWKTLAESAPAEESRKEALWRRTHQLRRRIALKNPLANVGPLLFVKHVPSNFSHQLTQYYGRDARPGGGVFVLDAPGKSMECRQLAQLPSGSYLHPEVSWDGQRVLFAYCNADSAPIGRESHPERQYHLYEMTADGSGLRQLTEGPYDDFSPRYLPDGKILFLSTRRGGFHRCGRGPCPVYTLTVAEADGSHPRTISFHETHEWDPAVLHDGRIIYTRWDYVDRNAVYYQQLWSARPDGSDVRAYYGNNTFNPVGIWEARPVPDSHLVMATAGAHHAMTAGSIILLDRERGGDGLEPISRLTPDALFPESEIPVQGWNAPAGVPSPPSAPPEARRWPGHCYRTPYPLSDRYFLAAYSFAPLIGEPHANAANMFGIYWVDRFGNKELLYRDLNISSLWPTPLRAKPRPPQLASTRRETEKAEGTFFVQNVYESWPKLPADATVERLRIVQVLLKTTPHANLPKVGLANASPGKQILGSVPVEADGSAYFRAPAGVPLLFQALDERGMAVQTMRSLTYLQPGEQATCVGCHAYPSRAPSPGLSALASARPPSAIAAGPDGSWPLSYPLLVQPVLDKHCVRCHGGDQPAANVVLTGEPQGEFSASYRALAPLTSYSQWNGPPAANAEPRTRPGVFGARGSRLMQLLLEGHQGVSLSAEDIERLAAWMDANSLFYGTFDLHDQKRQQQGERIAKPALP